MRTGYDTRGPRSGPPFDLREFRRQFQALSREDCIYLDNAATTFSCLAALDTWREAYAGGLGSPGRADHPLAREADRELAALRSRLGDRLGAGHDDDVVLTSSATEALNLLASGMEPTLRAGDLIVVSELEHHSNALPWHRLASRTGASVATLPVGEQGDLDLGIWDRLLNARPRLVAVTATSNVTGCRPDVSRLAREAHSEGARVIVDAAQALPHEPLNFEDLGCDAMVVSAHKMGAPRGVAAFVAKSSLAEELTPMLLGGGMVKDYAGADSVWSDVPERLEPGTRDLAALRAWLAAFELWHDDGGRPRARETTRWSLAQGAREAATHRDPAFGHRLLPLSGLLPRGRPAPARCLGGLVPPRHLHPHRTPLRSTAPTTLRTRQREPSIARSVHLCPRGRGVPRGAGPSVMKEARALAERLYGTEVAAWLDHPLAEQPVLPDVSTDAHGAACGDRVSLDLRDDGRVFVSVEGCILARASAAWLTNRAQALPMAELERLADEVIAGGWQSRFPSVCSERRRCVVLPWEALRQALRTERSEGESDKPGRARTALACDACVHSCRVRWEKDEPPAAAPPRSPMTGWGRRIRRLFDAIVGRGGPRFHASSRYGHLEIGTRERRRLRRLIEDADDGQVNYWYRTNVLGVVCSHVDEPLPPLLASGMRRLQLAHRERLDEAERLTGSVGATGVRPIKGLATHVLYDAPNRRTFKDLDYVAPSADAAFAFGGRLMREHGYRTSLSQRTAFSMKEAYSGGSAAVLSGHFHLERPGEHTRLVVDVSFPGVPVGLHDVLPTAGEARGAEVNVLDAVAHLLKHDLPRPKDLNDIRLLLSNAALKEERLAAALRRQGLTFRFQLAVLALGGASRSPSLRGRLERLLSASGRRGRGVARLLRALGWPHRPRTHFLAQACDQYFLERCRRTRREAVRGVGRMLRRMDTAPRSAPETGGLLPVPFGQRLYLIPVLFFRTPLPSARMPAGFRALDGGRSGFVERGGLTLFLSALGLFIATTDWRLPTSPRLLDEAVWGVVRELGLGQEDVRAARATA